MNNYKIVGVTVATLGIAFSALAIILNFNPSIKTSSGLITTNPAMITPYFIIGISFIISSIAGFWLSYLKYGKNKKLYKQTHKNKNIPKRVQVENQHTTYNFTYSLDSDRLEAKTIPPSTTPEKIEPQKTNSNKNFGYMLFVLGALLLIIGIYLSTYSTVAMIDQNINMPFGGMTKIPQATIVYPYQFIGIITIFSSFGLIIYALLEIKS